MKAKLNPNAAAIMVNRYSLRDEGGQPVESPAEILMRSARVVAEAENNYRSGGATAIEVREKFFEILYDMRFVPNGRTMANAGTKYGQLANCFVLPVDDDLGKGADSIFSVLRKAILTLQTGGGVGFSFGRIRPKDAAITTTKGKATGAVSFIKVYDTAFWVIGQGGGRRSAAMAVLPVWHPDILEFVKCKSEEGTITNFNISVGITDEFMQAVKKDDDFTLRHPENGEMYKMVPARELFAEIVKSAYKNGEPGVLFLDEANRTNPVPHLYKLEATNPCVTGDTLVATPNGWIRVDQINEGDKVNTVLGLGKIEKREVHEKKKIYLIKFSDGGVVKATAAHQFHTRSSRTKFFTPTKLSEITVGDWVRVAKSCLPSKMAPPSNVNIGERDYGFLTGVLLGDGCYTERSLSKNVVRISTHDDEREWNELLKQKFSMIGATNMYTYVNKNSHSMMMDPKPGKMVAEWVKSLKLTPSISLDKDIPMEYVNSNGEFLRGLLDGLFSTDGSVDLSANHPIVRFHTGSVKLAEKVRLILLMFGIHGRSIKSKRAPHKTSDGRIISNKNPKYDVVVVGESFGRFFEQITLSHPEKQAKMKQAALTVNFTGGNWAAQVKSIEEFGEEKVYDLYEPNSDTWITNGYVSRGCGEQFLGPYENCCLGSLNLREHIKKIKGDGYQVDWEKLSETIELAVRFLDNVVDANKYVSAVPELEEAAHKVRRIGLSVMGLSDMMYLVGVRYGGSKGQDLASQIMEFVRYHAMITSIKLARVRGPFPGIVGSIYDPQNMKWSAPKPLVAHKTDFGRPSLDWKKLIVDLKQYGIRNGAQTTVAPTGSIATISGLEGYGCEPVFALSYVRHTREGAEKEGKEWREMYYESYLFEMAMKKSGLSKSERNKLFEQVRDNGGSLKGISGVPKEIAEICVVSSDLSFEEHVRMQAVMQRWIDNSISKTINFPSTATPDDVAKAYQLGWELGLKGMTVYVEGSREQVILEKKIGPYETKEDKQVTPQELCPECGTPMRREEGCSTCPSCAYSKCDK
ncbi:MAG: ribonucleotide reductase N-terminal alpha domain-containing protein [bacterium]